LHAAHDAKIKRVVIVSSLAAIYSGHNGENRTFDENDWSDVGKDIGAYAKSKTLAERAAWDFINSVENTNKLELVAVNPPLILGPVPNKDLPTSAEMVSTLMLGQVPGVSRMKVGIVDVRDVASALILAMAIPEAAGNRFLCPAGTIWLKDFADILRKKYAPRGYRVNTLQIPVWAVRLLALFDKKIARVVGDLEWDFELSDEKIKRILKWSPRPMEEAILSMAESLIEQRLV
jgi:nucleoside-diphosphate-sugar epimerase